MIVNRAMSFLRLARKVGFGSRDAESTLGLKRLPTHNNTCKSVCLTQTQGLYPCRSYRDVIQAHLPSHVLSISRPKAEMISGQSEDLGPMGKWPD